AGADHRIGQGGHRVGETLAETRVEAADLRAENDRTAAELEARVRHPVDGKARSRENPLPSVGVGAAAVFLVAGGPRRVVRLLRRRVRPPGTPQACDSPL